MFVKIIWLILFSHLTGNVVKIVMSQRQQQSDERDYVDEMTMKIDDGMVNLTKSTADPDAELIILKSSDSEDIKRKKRQINPNKDQPNPAEEEPSDDNSSPSPDDATPNEEYSINLEVETSVTKTDPNNLPFSIITRPTTTTFRTQTSTPKLKVTYYTKKPIIFPSGTPKTRHHVENAAQNQNVQTAGLTFANRQLTASTSVMNMKLLSTSKRGNAHRGGVRVTKATASKILTTTSKSTIRTTMKRRISG